jgi:hypothetical protein
VVFKITTQFIRQVPLGSAQYADRHFESLLNTLLEIIHVYHEIRNHKWALGEILYMRYTVFICV